jgi:hypothetical protein
MYKVYTLPCPTFLEWLFRIRPSITVIAADGEEALSKIYLKHKGTTIGYIEVTFTPNSAVEMMEAKQCR